MQTNHTFVIRDARKGISLEDEHVDMVFTSPPYPMIEMWDAAFCSLNNEIRKALEREDGLEAFTLMHCELDMVWEECYRLLKPGSFLCINIGDATRKLGSSFRLYPNHSRIIDHCTQLGFESLPLILWRKPTNAPNKFMGSGMLPAGAYVTLEHEYVLVFRKGNRRQNWSEEEQQRRRRSGFFWEERNSWFSDIWELRGCRQQMLSPEVRKRSGAFPVELAYRLINMYSLQEDTVLDPFTGTGTTNLAAAASCRNSIGIEIDNNLLPVCMDRLLQSKYELNSMIEKRLTDHLHFLREREEQGKPVKYSNSAYRFPVMTQQETDLFLPYITTITRIKGETSGAGGDAAGEDRETTRVVGDATRADRPETSGADRESPRVDSETARVVYDETPRIYSDQQMLF